MVKMNIWAIYENFKINFGKNWQKRNSGFIRILTSCVYNKYT